MGPYGVQQPVSGSPTKVLKSLVERSVAHILGSYRDCSTVEDEHLSTENDEGAKPATPMDTATKLVQSIEKRRVLSTIKRAGYVEVEDGAIEAVVSVVMHLISKLCVDAQRLASHRNQSVTVMDILTAYHDSDPDSLATLASARRVTLPDGTTGIKYLTHLQAPPFPHAMDPRLEGYAERVLRRPYVDKLKRSHCAFPGRSPALQPGPNSMFATLLLDTSRRFYYALCLDLIRATIFMAAAHARKYQGLTSADGNGAITEQDLSEWGLEQDVGTKQEGQEETPLTPETMQSLVYTISGSEEALQNLVAQEVCGLTIHQRVSKPKFDQLQDPVDYFCEKLGFITPKMAAMIRSECYRLLISSWDDIAKTVYDGLHAARLGLGIVPHPIRRLSTSASLDKRPLPSHVTFVPFALTAGLKGFVEQPEPGGSVLGALATDVINSRRPMVMDEGFGSLIRSKQIQQLSHAERPPGCENYSLSDVVKFGPAQCPIYAPPIPDVDVFGHRLLIQGCSESVEHLKGSWSRWSNTHPNNTAEKMNTYRK